MKPRYAVIFGAMRTGSNLLERTLAGYDGLRAEGELFNPHFIGGPGRTVHLGMTLAAREADPLALLERVIAAGPDVPVFRIFDGHDPRVIAHAAADPDAARIILTRDPLDSFLSLQIARATGQWMLTRPERRRLARIRFDPAAFARYRDALAAHYAHLRALIAAGGGAAAEARYEALGDAAAVNRLAAAAGSPEVKRRLAPPIRRQNPPLRADRVTNPADLPAGDAPPPPEDHAFDPLAAMTVLRGLPAIHAVMPGGCAVEVERLMRAAGPPGAPLKRGLRPEHLARRRGRGEAVFAFVSHPVARLRRVWPRDVGFDAFLGEVEAALAGRMAGRSPHEWLPQAALLRLFEAETPVDLILRADRWREDTARLLARLGADAAVSGPPPAEAVDATPAQAGRIRRLHAEDFERFGF